PTARRAGRGPPSTPPGTCPTAWPDRIPARGCTARGPGKSAGARGDRCGGAAAPGWAEGRARGPDGEVRRSWGDGQFTPRGDAPEQPLAPRAAVAGPRA